jgi:large subunit ribosomal protein L5e
MPFVKIQKDKAYFKRYQTKYRRRREGKTDYYARKKLIVQAKNKYNTPKYRLVVRFTNKHVVCQIVMSEITGDRVVAHANSKELARYGVSCGLKNYAAAYCTGLLVGRRVLDTMEVSIEGGKKKLSEIYAGNKIVAGEEGEGEGAEVISCEEDGRQYFVDEVNEEARPFRCYLDVGLKRTALGCRIWGALKGAVDAGLDIPHNEKKWPGYDIEGKEYDPAEHRAKLTGEHVAEFMTSLSDPEWCEENGYQHPDDYQRIFSAYIREGVEGDDVVEMYCKAHDAIRADASPKEAEPVRVRNPAGLAGRADRNAKWKKGIKLTYEEKKANLQAKIDAMEEEDEDDEEDEEDDE